MNPIISVENLSKQYRIGTKLPYKTFRETLMNAITSPAKLFRYAGQRAKDKEQSAMPSALRSMPPSEDGYIWALKDVSFEVQEGEVLGIIGRNGAGKTTLLKILSRVTEPTKGEVKIRGRVGSLLEVGTGFHPELTGRENIFLNGAILGMRKEEIKKKFDEIVAFAEIEKFLDTPVKRYSSGMYVRLAFAVAAHLEPEILIVDEVLAVGDAQFQKKCLGKMGDVAKEGRTVLFVSHNLQSISELCNKTFLLDRGMVINRGKTEDVINNYVNIGTNMHMAKRDLRDPGIRAMGISNPMSMFKWIDISIVNSAGECVSEILFGEPFEIIFSGYSSEDCEHVLIGLAVSAKRLGHIFSTHQRYNGLPDRLPAGISEYRVRIELNMLAPGYYDIEIGAFGTGKVADYIKDVLSFSVSDAPYFPEKQWRHSMQAGFIYYPCQWGVNVMPGGVDSPILSS